MQSVKICIIPQLRAAENERIRMKYDTFIHQDETGDTR